MIKAHMTKDDNLRVSWLNCSLDLHHGTSSFMCTMRFVIVIPTINFRLI
jgi:hypothetical protein